jgi:hypothetical protein
LQLRVAAGQDGNALLTDVVWMVDGEVKQKGGAEFTLRPAKKSHHVRVEATYNGTRLSNEGAVSTSSKLGP